MGYKHYGRSGDIWKHLPLAQILTTERPATYIESNCAYASYELHRTPELDYGIYRLWDTLERHPQLASSKYIKILKQFNKGDRLTQYPGSAVQAIRLLEEWKPSYMFFDTDPAAVTSIHTYCQEARVLDRTEILQDDSIDGTYRLLDYLDRNALIFFDPYLVIHANDAGRTYLDCFLKAAQRGVRAVMWYGFMSRVEQKAVRSACMEGIKRLRISPSKVCAAELALTGLRDTPPPFNPGIAGCGLLMTNLRGSSLDAVSQLGKACEELYKGATYNGRYAAEQQFSTWLWPESD